MFIAALFIVAKMWKQLEIIKGDLPGGPVVRTPRFHCRGHRFNLWSGN